MYPASPGESVLLLALLVQVVPEGPVVLVHQEVQGVLHHQEVLHHQGVLHLHQGVLCQGILLFQGSPISMRISSSVRGSPTLVRISSFIRGSLTSMWPPRTIIITFVLSVFSTFSGGSSLYICVSLRGFSLSWSRNFMGPSSNRVSHWKRPRSIQLWHD